MIIHNIKQHPDLPWEEYLRLPATSFSGLKDIKIAETYGMRIGTLVHRYLLKPSEYNYEEADIVIPVANELVRYIGHRLLREMICECPITATFEHEDIMFDWKGIPDMVLPKVVVIDLKVIAGSLQDYIKRFNYNNQVRGYGMPYEVDHMMIIAYNKKARKVEHEIVFQDPSWWERVVMQNGKPKNEYYVKKVS